MKAQLANLPARALKDPALLQGVIALFREAILSQEAARTAGAIDQALSIVKAGLGSYADTLTKQIGEGTREAFAASITGMLSRALWIVILGVLVVLFIPELPLRTHQKPATADQN